MFITARISSIFLSSTTVHTWFSYVYSHYSPFQSFIWIQHDDQLPVDLFAQLVKHCILHSWILKNMDQGNITGALFIDLKRALDTLPHKGYSNVRRCDIHSHHTIFCKKPFHRYLSWTFLRVLFIKKVQLLIIDFSIYSLFLTSYCFENVPHLCKQVLKKTFLPKQVGVHGITKVASYSATVIGYTQSNTLITGFPTK